MDGIEVNGESTIYSPTTNELIAWAAGLFEGEGCIFDHKMLSSDKLHYTHHPRLVLGSTDKDVVYKFYDIVGCYGHVHHRKKYARMTKDAWEWNLNGWIDCKRVIAMFWPYLGERRKTKAIEIGIAPYEGTRK